ncbi:DsbA family protein [Rubellimicrobium aerolatum]|uniref:DsbA family protein n=1 Tax=Rubellimicrobium aerolatum TaxID=490979 RepID=A0ABW0SDY5_9RHOB|nr:thioredoxin domain-containing protein [Rubellimicrobium aerolatum]MBP1807031.1 protein-disulfide isomerase [Rubellimicrobium aerolatum]
MNRRAIVLGTAAAALAAFAGGIWVTDRQGGKTRATEVTLQPLDPTILVRANSPVLGPAEAPVTIVEFFDPSCEACRAFHPVLEQIRREFPTQVRVVMRYAAFHAGSDEAVRILEAARAQGVFEPVLNALLERQPDWALHDGPRLDLAWAIAGEAGLDVDAGQAYRQFPGVVAILNQDAADVEVIGIQQTPTFFINGQPLEEFGPEELKEAVRAEVAALGT